MSEQRIRVRSKTWTAVSATADETTALFNVKKGERVLWASAIPLVSTTAASVGTVALGDGTSTAGYLAAFTPTQAANPVGTAVSTQGALLASSGGKLYTVDDTVDVLWDYTSGGSAIPSVKFTIATVRE